MHQVFMCMVRGGQSLTKNGRGSSQNSEFTEEAEFVCG